MAAQLAIVLPLLLTIARYPKSISLALLLILY